MKQCKRCELTKEHNLFYKNSSTKDGIDYYCKECRNTSNYKSWYAKTDPCIVDSCDKPKYAKDMCKRHYERVLRHGTLETKNTRYDKDKTYINSEGYEVRAELIRKSHLKIKYDMTIEEYEDRAASGCECCGEKDYHGTMHVDHDHSCCDSDITCGKCVRGIVCASCNASIGSMENGGLNKLNPRYNYVEKYLERYAKIV